MISKSASRPKYLWVRTCPTIIDLYSSYQINRNLLLKFSVQNVMDKSYSEALNKLNMLPIQGDDATAANTARGRTYLFGGEVRF